MLLLELFLVRLPGRKVTGSCQVLHERCQNSLLFLSILLRILWGISWPWVNTPIELKKIQISSTQQIKYVYSAIRHFSDSCRQCRGFFFRFSRIFFWNQLVEKRRFMHSNTIFPRCFTFLEVLSKVYISFSAQVEPWRTQWTRLAYFSCFCHQSDFLLPPWRSSWVTMSDMSWPHHTMWHCCRTKNRLFLRGFDLESLRLIAGNMFVPFLTLPKTAEGLPNHFPTMFHFSDTWKYKTSSNRLDFLSGDSPCVWHSFGILFVSKSLSHKMYCGHL
jgi:hypothetical protein